MTTAPSHVEQSSAEVFTMNAAEWKAAVDQALAELHLTFDQLAVMARARDFVSLEAQKLWVAIGGKRP